MTRKMGDIIEFDVRIDVLIPDEDLDSGKTIDVYDYKRKYNVSFTVNDEMECDLYFLTGDEGTMCLEDDIRGLVVELMKENFPEVDEYEVFDVCEDYEHQYAKVKVKSLKN